MSWPALYVLKVFREPGVREVARPIVSRYLAGELPLERAARHLAMIYWATIRWKGQRYGRGVVRVPPDFLVLPTFNLPNVAGSVDVAWTASVRNPNPEEVYDEAVRVNAFVDALKQAHSRLTRAYALYEEVDRILKGSREDAA